jgi:hypothetical protein
MAAPFPDVGQHYGGTSIREDLTDVIFQITPTETPIMNMTSQGKCSGVVHEWQERQLTTRGVNAQAEGYVYDFDESVRRPTRVVNITQNMLKQIRVSSTNEAANHAGIAGLFADQAEVATIELKTDMEHAVVAGTIASGATDGVRTFAGLVQAISSNLSVHTTNTSVAITEPFFNDMLERSWDQGGAPRDWFMGATLKRSISGFTASSNSYRDQASGRVVNTISVYESDFFVIETHLSRDIPSLGLLGLDRTMLEFCLLRPVMMRRTADVASSTDGVVEVEGTLSWGNVLGHNYSDGWLAAA